ncbi:MAG: DUF1648 domain-containing protein [Clostridiaceae bacterium]|nr:DUF1648 domain-containing protein [Clostridiaceae bacterium]
MKDASQVNQLFFILNIFMILVIGTLLAILPYITRKVLLFGIRVPEMAHTLLEVGRMKRFYTIMMALVTLAALGAAVAGNAYGTVANLMICLYAPLVMMLAQFIVYLRCWRHSAALKARENWIIPSVGTAETRSARSRERFGGLPWIWYWGSFGLILLTLLLSLTFYPSMPDTIITHWNGAMEADAWAPKSLGHILAIPIISLVMLLIMLASNLAVYRMKLQVSQENPALSFAQHRVYRRLMSHMLGFITLCMTLMFLLMQPMIMNIWVPDTAVLMALILIPTVLMILPAIYVSVKAGQSGTKLRPAITEADVAAAGYPPPDGLPLRKTYSDDRYWKLGLFYYNPDDPSLLVEDRFGNNGGLNYARPAGIVLIVLLILFTAATYIGSTLLFIRAF